MIRRLAVAATALLLPFAAGSCGSSNDTPPTTAEISKQFQDGGMTEAAADCLAAKITKAKLTDDDIDEYVAHPEGKSEASTIIRTGYLDCAQVTVGG